MWRRYLWYSFRYYPNIYLAGLRKSINSIIQDSECPIEIQTNHVPNANLKCYGFRNLPCRTQQYPDIGDSTWFSHPQSWKTVVRTAVKTARKRSVDYSPCWPEISGLSAKKWIVLMHIFLGPFHIVFKSSH